MDSISYNPSEQKLALSSFITKVYGWMSVALAITALAAVFVADTPGIREVILGNRIVFYVLIFGEFGLVMAISAAINRMSSMTATLLFILYSLVNGLTLSVIFMVYTASSISTTFFVTAGTFGAMSIIGYTTKRDLTSMGNLLIMALIGIVIGSFVNFFVHSTAFGYVLTYLGILVFVGLTAYDTQKIKEMGAAGFDTSDARQKGAILGALSLYLDFINLFLLLLRLFGNRRN